MQKQLYDVVAPPSPQPLSISRTMLLERRLSAGRERTVFRNQVYEDVLGEDKRD